MPFVSEAQRRLCWWRYHQAIKQGRKPTWDCHEWAQETPKGLPYYSRKTKKRRTTRTSHNTKSIIGHPKRRSRKTKTKRTKK